MDLASALQIASEVRPLLLNPFEHPPDPTTVRPTFSQPSQLRQIVAELAAGGRAREAAWTVLAAGVHRLALGQTAVLGESDVAAETFASLGLTRTLVVSVVRAAHRCVEQLGRLVGVSSALRRLKAQVWKACFGPSLDVSLRLGQLIREQNVLIVGETGTGKELVAAALQAGAFAVDHADPPPARSINAAAIPDELLESELFGHVKGAFSSAVKSREGLLVEVHGGTFFLDEVADLSPRLQPKLLRVMETNRVTPIGANEDRPADVRYLAATSRLIDRMAERGEFRADLYERLAGLVLEVPPLRDRPDDVRAIAESIMDRITGATVEPSRTPVTGESWVTRTRHRLAEDLVSQLQSYRWPGNVRELENFVRTRLLDFQGDLRRRPDAAAADAVGNRKAPMTRPTASSTDAPDGEADGVPATIASFEAALEDAICWYVTGALAVHDGNQVQAARSLQIDRGTLSRYLKKAAGKSEPPR